VTCGALFTTSASAQLGRATIRGREGCAKGRVYQGDRVGFLLLMTLIVLPHAWVGRRKEGKGWSDGILWEG